MFQLTVEESISTLILLESLIDSVEDDESAYALEYAHDEIDSQMLDAFGINEDEVDEEVFDFLRENLKVKIKYNVDNLVLQILKAVYTPLIQLDNDDLDPEVKMHAAKILFKLL